MLARRACDVNERRYDCSKFVLQCVDFWAPYEIARNDSEMSSYVAVLCIRGRGERSCYRVL